ncbi:HD-GYP domain-containing protein [Crenothrix polyspora]|uniref:Metal-dependent phosphohydrolase, HD subdomain n=1 Tax=Crenothrix polyspora TaxID=360316 RepID=A0A1R4HEJ1_9GAMM|nr:HD-GYP domain-containing protein [Crenothrix polyspora]SJM94310.1 Metal-dependent phosphohydrolase, HD subdomain [Crenothrix polyspora]
MNTNTHIFLASSNVLTQIDVKDLQIGMYVSKLDKPWLESTFLFQGFELMNQEDIIAIKNECSYVFIDTEKQNKFRHSDFSDIQESKSERESYKKRSSFNKEIDRAKDTYQKTSSLVKGFMDGVALGRGINVEIAKKAVAECVECVLKSPDAILWMTQLKNRDIYTAQHSMNVCLLAILLGRQVNLSIEELNQLGLCGMMHDMGKMLVPLEVLNKPGRLDELELAWMKKHPEFGRNLLIKSKDMYGGAIDVAYSHHERIDGGGYPRGLKGEHLSPETRMVTIVDMYDAMTSDRVYQKGRTHRDAIDDMLKMRGSHLDAGYLIKFIEALGLYPAGSIVEMSNGEVGIVIEVDASHQLKPKVLLCLNEDKKPQTPRTVDLLKLDLDAFGKTYKIKKIVNSSDYGISNETIDKYLRIALSTQE